MKTILFSANAASELRRHASEARRIVKKIEAYAATGAGDVKDLVDRSEKRLRVGDFRILFIETETEIQVVKIGPRKNVYD